MKISSEQDMLNFGAKLAQNLDLAHSITIELIGDVGAGKTTLVRGLASALGITEPVTSPSFTISKQYAFLASPTLDTPKATPDSPRPHRLIHYDFYRLSDPGLMQEDLLESLADPHAIVVVEWAETVADLLPPERITIKITTLDSGARSVEISAPSGILPPDFAQSYPASATKPHPASTNNHHLVPKEFTS